jgi:hypothetical protein
MAGTTTPAANDPEGATSGPAAETSETKSSSPAPPTQGWGQAALRAVVVLILSDVFLLLIPNRLLAYLTTRVGPNVRDAVVTGWVTVFFIGLSWVLLALQRPGKRA